MVNIVLTEKQLKVITDKVLIEDKSNKETLNEDFLSNFMTDIFGGQMLKTKI